MLIAIPSYCRVTAILYLQLMTCDVYAFQAQRAIGCFVVANCIASGVFIIAVASIYCAQTQADRMPALIGREVIK